MPNLLLDEMFSGPIAEQPGTGPYAVVTSDPAELRTALTSNTQQDTPTPRTQTSPSVLTARMLTRRS